MKYLISQRLLLFLGLLLLPLLSVFAANSEPALQALIASGEIRPQDGDKVFLLSQKGPFQPSIVNQLLPIKNFSDAAHPKGNCMGMHQVQLGLMSAIKFEREGKMSDEEIYQALVKASDADSFSQQIIRGYSSLEEFLKDMQAKWSSLNPLYRAIQKLQGQTSVGLDVNSQISAQNSSAEHQMDGFSTSPEVRARIPDPRELVETIKQKLQKNMPASLAAFASGEAAGHTLTVVGYIENENEKPTRRFLVSDPNHPGKLKIIKLEIANGKSNWTYDLSSNPNETAKNRKVDLGLMNQGSLSSREQAFRSQYELRETDVEAKDSALSQAKVPPGFCHPRSRSLGDIGNILSHSKH